MATDEAICLTDIYKEVADYLRSNTGAHLYVRLSGPALLSLDVVDLPPITQIP